MQVDPNTVSSDTFVTNIQALLLRFCEPFMDANYTKVIGFELSLEIGSLSICQSDRIERLYFAQSDRIDLKDETRVSATAKEAEEWNQQHRSNAGM